MRSTVVSLLNQSRRTSNNNNNNNIMSDYYSFYGDGNYHSSPVNQTLVDGEPATAVEYFQAVLAFILGLGVYFCILCNIWLRDGAITQEEVERSIVHKRVLAHGQSHHFDCDYNQDDECLKKHSFCRKVATSCRPCRSVAKFWRKKRMQAIIPVSADSIKDSNRCDPKTSQTEDCKSAADMDDHDAEPDELDQAERGLVAVALNDEITCPICLEPLKLGEEVAWSKLRHCCLHVYHFECITKWLYEGNMYCPVCRDRYWKRNYRKCSRVNVCTNFIYRKESTPIDSMDARRYQFCEFHGLTRPVDSAEDATSCTSSGRVLKFRSPC
jgi:hypothetical protein